MGLEFRVLGPLRVRRDDVDVELGGPRQKRLLLLLLQSGRDGVSDDRIVADLLSGDEVRRPEATLRTYVSRLRRALDTPGDGQLTRVERLAAGYRLRVEDGEFDAATFYLLASRGQRQLEHGDDSAAAETLTDALGLWCGPPCSEVADEPWAAAEIERLTRTHASVRLGLADARLRMGRVSDVITDLRGLAAQEPFGESVVQRLMVAHYVAGDPSAALEVFTKFRDRLADELGLDPGGELVELHRRILQRDPELGLEDVVGWSLRGYRLHAPLGRDVSARSTPLGCRRLTGTTPCGCTGQTSPTTATHSVRSRPEPDP